MKAIGLAIHAMEIMAEEIQEHRRKRGDKIVPTTGDLMDQAFDKAHKNNQERIKRREANNG